MGDMNQLLFAKSYVHLVKGPILEVGSRDYGTTQISAHSLRNASMSARICCPARASTWCST